MKSLLLFSQLLLLSASVSAVGPADIRLTPIVTDLEMPVALVQPSDGSAELFVAEAGGVIRVIDGHGMRPEPFLDIRDRVIECCESGGALLSLAFDPDFPVNRSFYVLYVNRDADTVLSRFEADPTPPASGIPSSETILFVVDQPEEHIPNHQGGDLHFGPDGFLYVTIGDGGTAAGVTERAQELWHLLGKILRIDVDRGEPYAIPTDNPFVDVDGARPEIWAFGLRNPWRFSFDRATGDLAIADVGEQLWEEVNLDNLASTKGVNYGWPRMEGLHCFDPVVGCNDGTLLLPDLEYTRDDGCSVTGGYVYRGPARSLDGTYLYGDFCSGKIWGARKHTDGSWSSKLLLDTDLVIVSFGEDRSGNVYVLDFQGSIHRIDGPEVSRRRLIRRR